MKKSALITITITTLILIGVFATSLFLFLRNSQIPRDSLNTEEVVSIPGDAKPYNFDYSWIEKGPYIAHAMGGIDGSNYSNSYEAFRSNYEAGQRLFEADFSLTDDGDVVLMHTDYEWENRLRSSKDLDFTTKNFLSSLYDGKFHTMDYRKMIDLMIEHPDIYLITDSKYTDRPNVEKEFTQIIEYAQSKDPSVLNRFVIQIYLPEMLDWVMALHPWRSVIYTLYQDPNWTTENVRDFALESGVKVITTGCDWIDDNIAQTWHDAGLTIAAFTTNDLNKVQSLVTTYDVKLFYTDYLLPYTYNYIATQ